MRVRRKFFVVLLLVSSVLLTMSAPALAIPANPHPREFVQPDGTVIEIVMRGDEYVHWFETKDGYALAMNGETGYYEFADLVDGKLTPSGFVYRGGARGESKGLRPNTAKVEPYRKYSRSSFARGGDTWWKPIPASGECRLLPIRVEFRDRKFTTPESYHYNQLWGEEKSLKAYYRDQSRGKADIVPAFPAHPVITVTLDTPHPNEKIAFWINVYQNNDPELQLKNMTEFVQETLLAALDKIGERFDGFDTNGDGFITPDEVCVYLFVAGYDYSAGSGKTPCVWAHAENELSVEVHGKKMRDSAINGELANNGVPMGVAVIAHEMGHQFFNLPDLYDLNYANYGMSTFSHMAAGVNGCILQDDGTFGPAGEIPVGMDAWSRQYLGWETPQRIYGTVDGVAVTTPATGEGRGSVRLSGEGHRPTEYFLAEVRDLSGWDAALANLLFDWNIDLPREVFINRIRTFQGGLLIQHIDDTAGSGAIDISNDINCTAPDGNQGVLYVDARDPKLLGEEGALDSLWFNGNLYIPEHYIDEESGKVGFTAPASNFYTKTPNVAETPSGISIKGINLANRGTIVLDQVTAGVPAGESVRSSSSSSVGCAAASSSLAIVALLALLIRPRRRTKK